MKVAIIGAGISGLYTAWKLAKMGHDVTVFERRDKIGKEVCSGLFSENIFKFIPESRSLVQNEIDYCKINFPKKSINVKFSKKFLVMSHAALDRLVASLAEKAGAKIVLNYKSATENLDTLKKEFDRVIATDGAMSQTRKALGLKDPYFYIGIQVFSDQDISPSKDENFVDVWPTKGGFLWKIPRKKDEDGSFEYGVMDNAKVARKIFDDFLKEHNLKFNVMKSAVISNGLVFPQGGNITLCGDACGITKPWSGGGVAWILYCSEILLKNFPNFLKYQIEAKRFFLPKIIISKICKWGVYFLGFNAPWVMKKNYVIDSDFLV